MGQLREKVSGRGEGQISENNKEERGPLSSRIVCRKPFGAGTDGM